MHPYQNTLALLGIRNLPWPHGLKSERASGHCWPATVSNFPDDWSRPRPWLFSQVRSKRSFRSSHLQLDRRGAGWNGTIGVMETVNGGSRRPWGLSTGGRLTVSDTPKGVWLLPLQWWLYFIWLSSHRRIHCANMVDNFLKDSCLITFNFEGRLVKWHRRLMRHATGWHNGNF